MIKHQEKNRISITIEEEYISHKLQSILDENQRGANPNLYRKIIKSFVALGINRVNKYTHHHKKNCFGFAFNISNNKYRSYLKLVQKKNVTLVESKQVEELIYRGILKTVPEVRGKQKATEGNLVIYRNIEHATQITHAGIVVEIEPEVIIHSKWGFLPAIFEHKLDEVPSGYGLGDDAEYFYIADRKELQKYVEEIPKTESSNVLHK